MNDREDKFLNPPNVKAGNASAYGPGTIGCKATGSDVMVSFGSLVPYGDDNRPHGALREVRVDGDKPK